MCERYRTLKPCSVTWALRERTRVPALVAERLVGGAPQARVGGDVADQAAAGHQRTVRLRQRVLGVGEVLEDVEQAHDRNRGVHDGRGPRRFRVDAGQRVTLSPPGLPAPRCLRRSACVRLSHTSCAGHAARSHGTESSSQPVRRIPGGAQSETKCALLRNHQCDASASTRSVSVLALEHLVPGPRARRGFAVAPGAREARDPREHGEHVHAVPHDVHLGVGVVAPPRTGDSRAR